MNVVTKHLPPFCYSNDTRPIEGDVVHYMSCITADPDRWDDPVRCWQLFHDLNRIESLQRYAPWSIKILKSPDKRFYVSADGMITRDGDYWELVPRGKKSWHAGVSSFRGRPHCNDFMAGYELIAAPQLFDRKTLSDDQYHELEARYGFTEAQYQTLAELCKRDMSEFGFGIESITGHDVVAPGRKRDPGPSFSYSRLFDLIHPPHDLDGG